MHNKMEKQNKDFKELVDTFYDKEVPNNGLPIIEDTKTISEDELEISKLFSTELLHTFNVVFSKVPFRKIGPLIIDDLICLLKVVPSVTDNLTPQELDLINNRIEKLFHILIDCIVDDPTYKEKFIEYKQKIL